MPQVAPAFVTKLTAALRDRLEHAGIKAEIKSEPVETTNLYRFFVLASAFEKMKPSERQSIVWRVAEENLSKDEQFLISMILTLSPKEYSVN